MARDEAWKLRRARWLKLSDFRKLVPEYSYPTLARWALAGKLPVSKRGGSRYWVDMQAFRALRRNGSEDILMSLGESDDEDEREEVEPALAEILDRVDVPLAILKRWQAGQYHPHKSYGFVWFADGSDAESYEMGFSNDPVRRMHSLGFTLVAVIPGTGLTARQVRADLGYTGAFGPVKKTSEVAKLVAAALAIQAPPTAKNTWKRQPLKIVSLDCLGDTI